MEVTLYDYTQTSCSHGSFTVMSQHVSNGINDLKKLTSSQMFLFHQNISKRSHKRCNRKAPVQSSGFPIMPQPSKESTRANLATLFGWEEWHYSLTCHSERLTNCRCLQCFPVHLPHCNITRATALILCIWQLVFEKTVEDSRRSKLVGEKW